MKRYNLQEQIASYTSSSYSFEILHGIVFRVRTIPVLGYWELGDICMYWVVLLSGRERTDLGTDTGPAPV